MTTSDEEADQPGESRGEPGESQGQPGESRKERVDRELIELLNELRVALPGVQVLFAFLLILPFQASFAETTDLQRTLYVGALLASAAATALIIAPSSYHRINFRKRNKERMLFTSNRLLIAGLSATALGIVLSVVLVLDLFVDTRVAATIGIGTAVWFAWYWFVLPWLRRRDREESDEELDPEEDLPASG
jgi:hypothetical protein